jgi:dTDP-4-dehydrorhamnose 3,5-epimerase
MHFTKTELPDAWLIELDRKSDSRGYFARTFCEKAFDENRLNTRFVQHSTSFSKNKGTLRGMHYQKAPHSEIKVVRCVRGAIYDVIIDLRPDSPSLHNWIGFELSQENGRQLYVPQGFAHGFQTLTDDVEVHYLISEFYNPSASTGVRFDDPAFAIDWPVEVSEISERDRAWPFLL